MFKFCPVGAEYAALVNRVVLGIIFIAHGGQSVGGFFGGHGLEATIQGFQGMGLPAIVAILVAFGEFLGGIALVLGLLTRIAAVGIAIIMLGAVFTVHWEHGFFLNWFMVPDKGHGFEYNLALMGMAVAAFFSGAGKLSIDCLLGKFQDTKLAKHSYEERTP